MLCPHGSSLNSNSQVLLYKTNNSGLVSKLQGLWSHKPNGKPFTGNVTLFKTNHLSSEQGPCSKILKQSYPFVDRL